MVEEEAGGEADHGEQDAAYGHDEVESGGEQAHGAQQVNLGGGGGGGGAGS